MKMFTELLYDGSSTILVETRVKISSHHQYMLAHTSSGTPTFEAAEAAPPERAYCVPKLKRKASGDNPM